MRPTEEFRQELEGTLNEKAGDKKLALWDGLVDKLIDLLIQVIDSCIGQLTPSQQAKRMADPSPLDRTRFKNAVRRNVYDNDGKKFSKEGGKEVANSVWEVTGRMGAEKCEALVKDATSGDNWWPQDLFMG